MEDTRAAHIVPRVKLIFCLDTPLTFARTPNHPIHSCRDGPSSRPQNFGDCASQLNVDLAFQDFDRELSELPGDYAQPRGVLLLVKVDGLVAGCCALRPLDAVDYPNACEMKRLYVRRAYRGLGLGRRLVEAILDSARSADYACVLLDTLDDMESARALYEGLGFENIPPYYHNPIAGAYYLKADL